MTTVEISTNIIYIISSLSLSPTLIPSHFFNSRYIFVANLRIGGMLKTCLNIIWSFGEGIAFSSHILLKILELEENWRKILNISKSEYYSVGGVLEKESF